MSQKTLISYYQKKQKKDKDRISSFLSGRSIFTKKRKAASPATAEAAASTSAETAPSFLRGETEIEDVLIRPMEDVLMETTESGRTSPSAQARKRRRTEKGREEQHSDGNFSKIFKIYI
jgi:hypothetical protein